MQQQEAYATVAAARAAGVTMAMGHDSGPPGDNLIELVRMADAGLGNAEDDVGVVREGAMADLLVVDGDPLAGIAVLAERGRIWLVLVAGRPVAGQALAPATLKGLASA